MDEVAYGSNKEYAKKVSRWLDKKFKQFRIDKDTHFNRFEISLRNNPQPTHALANGFNPQLHTLPTDNDIERRNTIAGLLSDWGLVGLVGTPEPKAPLSQIKVLSFNEKDEWILETKYNIGKKKDE